MPRPYLDLRGEPSRVYVDLLESVALAATDLAIDLDNEDFQLDLGRALANLQEDPIWMARYPAEDPTEGDDDKS